MVRGADRFWALVFCFGVLCFAGLTTYFLAYFLLGIFVGDETRGAVSMIVSIAAMLNASILLRDD